MSPLFQPEFDQVDATIHIYDKGRYRIKSKSPKGFFFESKDDQGNVVVKGGVRITFEMVGMFDEDGEVDGEDIAGKTVSSYTIWLHTEGGWQYGKPAIMALCGYNPKDRNAEQKANEELFQDGDWGVNGEPGDPADAITLGASWNQLADRLVDVTLSRSINEEKDGDRIFENQEFNGWTPVE